MVGPAAAASRFPFIEALSGEGCDNPVVSGDVCEVPAQ